MRRRELKASDVLPRSAFAREIQCPRCNKPVKSTSLKAHYESQYCRGVTLRHLLRSEGLVPALECRGTSGLGAVLEALHRTAGFTGFSYRPTFYFSGRGRWQNQLWIEKWLGFLCEQIESLPEAERVQVIESAVREHMARRA